MSHRTLARVLRLVAVVAALCLTAACTSTHAASDPTSAGSSGSSSGRATQVKAHSVASPPEKLAVSPSDPTPHTVKTAKVPASGGTVTRSNVSVTVPAGAFPDDQDGVSVRFGASPGYVRSPYATELFGAPIGIDHHGDVAKPVTVTWSVSGMTKAQRDAVLLAHWDPESRSWQSTRVKASWSGNHLSARLSHFSWWTWVTDRASDVSQRGGEITGTRVSPPKCSGKHLPTWVHQTVSPSEDTSGAAIQVCFEPDKKHRVTVRVANNRSFTQMMTMSEGSQHWAWTWPGSANYSVSGDVYAAARAVFDSKSRYVVPPLHEVAVGISQPSQLGQRVIAAKATVDARTFLIDVAAFSVNQVSIGGMDNPVLDAFLQVLYECGGKDLLADGTPRSVSAALRAVVSATAGCSTEILRPDSELGKRFEKLSRTLIAKNKKSLGGAGAVVRANRAVRHLARFAKVLTFAQVVFYASDQIANALVGPLSWSIRGNGEPQTLGEWTPTCTDLHTDSGALHKNLAVRPPFNDNSKELWQYPEWKPDATRAVAPLSQCSASYRKKLAKLLPTDWADAKAARTAGKRILALSQGASPQGRWGHHDFAVMIHKDRTVLINSWGCGSLPDGACALMITGTFHPDGQGGGKVTGNYYKDSNGDKQPVPDSFWTRYGPHSEWGQVGDFFVVKSTRWSFLKNAWLFYKGQTVNFDPDQAFGLCGQGMPANFPNAGQYCGA